MISVTRTVRDQTNFLTGFLSPKNNRPIRRQILSVL
uniref:Uncharacterized protein n=1 Tax=Anguilla anguilla TaxID=7936 RepID=A0A0E9W7W2_ANGAN